MRSETFSNIEIEWQQSGATPQPVWFTAPDRLKGGGPLPAGEALALRAQSGATTPVQRMREEQFVALLTPRAGVHRYELIAGDATALVTARIDEEEGRKGQLELRVGEALFGNYQFSHTFPRPFIYPVFGPDGVGVTRNYPMRDDVPGEPHDHPHHRSLWTAYGEVNGADNWSEEKGHAWVRHIEFVALFSGPVIGGFVARNCWVDARERPQMEERREVLLYNAGDDRRLLDYNLTFTAGDEAIVFGDTKEGGLLSVRVATPMDGSRGGTIENARGGRGERECWGRRAAWCDYSGVVEGKKVGIAILDHPDNLRHPVHWHARDYGLLTANPFGASTFEGDGGKRGEYTLQAGESIRFRYRVLVHRGDATSGRVAEAWEAFARPARVGAT